MKNIDNENLFAISGENNVNNFHSTKTKTGDEKEYIWMDPEIESEENQIHYKALFTEKNIECKKYDKIDDAFNYLKKEENDFKEIVIITSGKYFNNLYYMIKNNIKSIKFAPIIVVFTEEKDLFIKQLKINNLYYNNDLFDPKLIFTNQIQLECFLSNEISSEGKDLSFDLIDNLEQLIIPTYYTYLLEDVKRPEIEHFNGFVEKNFLPPTEKEIKELNEKDIKKLSFKLGNKKIQELIGQIKNKTIPKEIIIKYWLRIYCSHSDFYGELNKSLRNKDNKSYFYYPFIKLCYEGIKKGFLDSYYEEIYRCSKIGKLEFKQIEDYFNKNKKNLNYPNVIIFSRSFLSFTTEEKIAKKFSGAIDGTYSILYKIEKIKDKKRFKNKIFNANIDSYSVINEKEILIFPFTCFEIISIEKINKDKINYQINLKYLGNYFENKGEEEVSKYFDNIPITNFSEELMEKNILKTNNFLSIWIKKKTLGITPGKICFFLEGKQDYVSFLDNIIYVFNIQTSKMKQQINSHKNQILDIFKLKSNKICVFYKDGILDIIKFNGNNEKIELLNSTNLYQDDLAKVLFLKNENFLCVDSKNNIKIFEFKDKAYNYKKDIKEENEIIKMKELPDNRIIYIMENKDKNEFIGFIDLKKETKEDRLIRINENKLKLIDLIIFYDYILICYDHQLDIINYQEKDFQIKTLKIFDYEITNIIQLSSDKIILGLYDSKHNKSFIRENLLKVEDLKNNTYKFDTILQGALKSNEIKDILKINEYQILIKRNSICIIYERKNEVCKLLKEYLFDDNKNEIIFEEGKNRDYEIDYLASFNIKKIDSKIPINGINEANNIGDIQSIDQKSFNVINIDNNSNIINNYNLPNANKETLVQSKNEEKKCTKNDDNIFA